MYRRIEVVGIGGAMAVESGMEDLKAPWCKINHKDKFFFTKKGWDKFGRLIVAAAYAQGIAYRVVAVKEARLDVGYKDRYQVAGKIK